MSESNQTTPSQPRRYSWPVVLFSLLFLYPLGLFLLWKKPRRNLWSKPLAAILTLPPFVLFSLFLLRPFWDFPGSVTSFSLDLNKGFLHWRELEHHRAAQKNLVPTYRPAFDDRRTWPSFRGLNRDGLCEPQEISLDWTTHPPACLYRQPIGEGYASFVVAYNRAFTIEQRRSQEVITCYDFLSGHELWSDSYRASFDEVLGGRGPRATPTRAGSWLFALGAEGRLTCLDAADGREIWHYNILRESHSDNLEWALAGAPLVVGDKVLVTGSGKPKASIFAFNAMSGSLHWTTDVGVEAYTSLLLATICAKQQVLNLAHNALDAIDPDNGKILWTFPWTMGQGPTCAQPILAGQDRIFISSGYDKGCALIRIELTNGTFHARELWQNKNMKNKFASSVIYQNHIYGLDEGILACLDLETGARKWKEGRYGHGSLLLVENHLVILSEEGRLALVDADPREFHERTSLQILRDRTWNNFVLLDGYLLARNHKEMVCYDLQPRRI